MTTQTDDKTLGAFRSILANPVITKWMQEQWETTLALEAILAMDDSLEQIAQDLCQTKYSQPISYGCMRGYWALGHWPEWLTRETLQKMEAAGYAKHEHGGPATFGATTWYIYPQGGANA